MSNSWMKYQPRSPRSATDFDMDTFYKADAKELGKALQRKIVDLTQQVLKQAGQPVRKPRSAKKAPPLTVRLGYSLLQLSKSFTTSTHGANFADTVRMLTLPAPCCLTLPTIPLTAVVTSQDSCRLSQGLYCGYCNTFHQRDTAQIEASAAQSSRLW